MTATRARRDAHLDVGRARVRYTDLGPDDPNGRAPVLLLPGTGGPAARHFAFLHPMLATDRRTIAMDYSQWHEDTPLTVEDLATQTEAILDELAADTGVVLCGYSLGAVVAAAVAARRPDSVKQLVLICGWARTDGHQQLRNEVWQALRKEDSPAMADFSVFCAFSPSYIAGRLPAEFEALRAGMGLPEGIDAQMDLNRRIDIEHLLPSITAPTLVVGATFDQMVPVRQTKFLWGGIADARYVELPTGHAVLVERPAQVQQLISDFCRDPAAVPAGDVVHVAKP